MNKLLIFLILIVLLSCHEERKTKIVETWDNGKAKVVLTFVNSTDSLSYLREYYYENGKLGAKGKYVNGKQDGLWEWWFENGKKKDEAIIKQGVYIGQRKHWWENGNLKQLEIIEGECLGDCCDGQTICYYENGNIESESITKNGQRDGKYVYRYDNGQVKKQEYFKLGLKQGNYNEWYRDGKKWVEGFYKNDRQDSVWVWYDSIDQIKTKHLYKDGEFIQEIKGNR